jgi:hypothetical protein
MKKILSLSFILLLSNLISQAQIVSAENVYHRNVLSALLQPQMQIQHAEMKTTSVVRERLVAQSMLDNTIIPHSLTDSVHLGYTGNRSSSYDFNMMLYAFNYPYGNTPMFNYYGLFTKPQLLSDTLKRWIVNPVTLLYGYYGKALSNYDALNDLTNYTINYTDSVTFQNASYQNSYNAAGNIVKGYTFFMNAGIADSAYAQYYSYNTANKIIQDSVFVYTGTGWRIIAKSYYAYDASGNVITIDTYADSVAPLREKLKYINTYDAGNRLLTVQASYFDGTNLVPYVRDTFAYTGGLNFNTSWKEYQYDGINSYWAPNFYEAKHVNTASLPDTIYIQGWDSLANNWVPQTMQTCSYDTFKLPVKLMSYLYNGTSYPVLASTVTSYYYQRFNDNTAVPDVIKLPDVKIYPNPASEKLNISIGGLAADTRIQIMLYNVKGQKVRSLNTMWANVLIQIPVADLNTGTYWISIQDVKGDLLNRQVFIKQ